jgi:hypothetical protein
MNLESRLRDALQPVDPPAGFASRVRARVERDMRAEHAVGGGPSASGWRSWMATAAAVLLLAVGGYGYRQYEERRDALAARSQVLLALQITSRALETVHRQVVQADTGTDAPRDDAGAEGDER